MAETPQAPETEETLASAGVLTSIDKVPAKEINKDWADNTGFQLGRLRDKLNAKGRLDASDHAEIAERIFEDLPDAIKAEFLHTDLAKQEIAGLIGETLGNGSFDVKDHHIQNLASGLANIFLKHHLNALVNSPNAYGGEVDFKKYEERVVTEAQERAAIFAKEMLTGLIFVTSAATTFTGSVLLAGIMVESGEALAGQQFAAGTQWGLRMAIASFLAVGTSGAVYLYKKGVEMIMHHPEEHGDKGLVRSYMPWNVIRAKGWRTPMAALALVSLTADGLTNVSGVANYVGSRGDAQMQIDDIREQLDNRTEPVRDQIRGLGLRLGHQVDTEAQGIISDEKAGKGVSNAPGEGAMYWAKNLAYLERDRASVDAAIASGNTQLQQVLTAIETNGLLNGQTVGQEVVEIVDGHTDKVTSLLDEIDARLAALSPDKEHEYLQEDVDECVALLMQVNEILSQDLSDDLSDHFQAYQQVNKALTAYATAKYPNPKISNLNEFDVPVINVDASEISVNSIQFKWPHELAEQHLEGKTSPQKAALILAALLYAFLVSHGDSLFLLFTKPAYKRDRENRLKHEKTVDAYISKIAHILSRALNAGPFSRMFKDANISPAGVERELRDYLKELGAKPDTLVGRVKHDWLPGDGAWTMTEEARDHNRYVAGLIALRTNPDGAYKFVVERLMPGQKLITEGADLRKEGQESNGDGMNNARIYEINDREELIELEELKADLEQTITKLKRAILKQGEGSSFEIAQLTEESIVKIRTRAKEIEEKPVNKEHAPLAKKLAEFATDGVILAEQLQLMAARNDLQALVVNVESTEEEFERARRKLQHWRKTIDTLDIESEDKELIIDQRKAFEEVYTKKMAMVNDEFERKEELAEREEMRVEANQIDARETAMLNLLDKWFVERNRLVSGPGSYTTLDQANGLAALLKKDLPKLRNGQKFPERMSQRLEERAHKVSALIERKLSEAEEVESVSRLTQIRAAFTTDLISLREHYTIPEVDPQ